MDNDLDDLFADPLEDGKSQEQVEQEWETRRPWVTRNGTIYIGEPGSHHPDLAKQYNIPLGPDQYDPEHDEIGDIMGGVARDQWRNTVPHVQRFYQKHFQDVDAPRLARARRKWSRKLQADIAPQRWVYLNGEVEFGSHLPQLVQNLGDKQGLQEANRLANLVGAGQWPITHEQLAVGDIRSGLVQIDKSNYARDLVQGAVEAALDNQGQSSYTSADDRL